MSPTFSLTIPHTPWISERAEALAKLAHALAPLPVHRIVTEREHRAFWSERGWRWAAEQDVTHCLFICDDTLVAPGFWDILRTMVTVKSDVAIGLMSPLPDGPRVVRSGLHWYTIGAGVTGPGYLLPRAMLREFLIWRGKQSWDFVTGEWGGDDQLINWFLSGTGRVSHHPCPTCADHDTALGSTLGHPIIPMTRPSVLWTGECPWTEDRFDPFDLEAMKTEDFWRTETIALGWPKGT